QHSKSTLAPIQLYNSSENSPSEVEDNDKSEISKTKFKVLRTISDIDKESVPNIEDESSDEESFRDDNYSSDSSDDTNAQQSTVQKQRFQTLTNCKRPHSNKKLF
ncbi:14038_t:CDS:2, partial [Gigaspora margarita]